MYIAQSLNSCYSVFFRKNLNWKIFRVIYKSCDQH